jgi:hypothetical protein
MADVSSPGSGPGLGDGHVGGRHFGVGRLFAAKRDDLQGRGRAGENVERSSRVRGDLYSRAGIVTLTTEERADDEAPAVGLRIMTRSGSVASGCATQTPPSDGRPSQRPSSVTSNTSGASTSRSSCGVAPIEAGPAARRRVIRRRTRRYRCRRWRRAERSARRCYGHSRGHAPAIWGNGS